MKGYHVCEATILGEKEKQPFSVYSKIYSCKSESFVSMNRYTMESIQTVINVLNRKCNMIFDRGYDDNKIIEYVDQSNNYFVIRMNDKRNFLFKGRKRMLIKKRLKEKAKSE